MQLALRPAVTAGVALVGAGAIAVSPVAPSLPNIHLPGISDAQFQMAAFVNPIEEWAQVIGTSFADLAGIGTQIQSDPAPIVAQLLQNQIANFNTLFNSLFGPDQGAVGIALNTLAELPQTLLTAANQVAAGQVADAVQTIWGGALLPPIFAAVIPLNTAITIAQKSVQNLANVIQAAGTGLLTVGIAAISPFYATLTEAGNAAQAVVDAAKAGDLGGVASAIINAPATLTNAFLNGNDSTPGLLTPSTGVGGGGPIAALLSFRDSIAQALGATPPAATAAVSAPPSSAAKTVTLSIAPKSVRPAATAPKSSTDQKSTGAAASDPAQGTAAGSATAGTDKSSANATAGNHRTRATGTSGKHRAAGDAGSSSTKGGKASGAA